jgi:hypothetical protein
VKPPLKPEDGHLHYFDEDGCCIWCWLPDEGWEQCKPIECPPLQEFDL